MFSGIRLGDGYLYLYELYQLQLSAELLTLSGCATGLNVIAAGDEVLGLIRGALYAGARSLLLTLWEVNDRSSGVQNQGRGSRRGGQGGAENAPTPLSLGPVCHCRQSTYRNLEEF